MQAFERFIHGKNIGAPPPTLPVERNDSRPAAQSFEHRQEQVLHRLEELGILEHHGGQLVVDMERLKTLGFNADIRAKSARRFNRTALLEALQGVQVLSKNEWSERHRNRNVVSAPLLYRPGTLQDALDPTTIRKDRSHMGPWDIGQSTIWNEQVTLPTGEQIGMDELYLSKKLFGELRAQRTAQGTLELWDEDSNRFVPLSIQFLRSKITVPSRQTSQGLSMLSSPIKYVAAYCKHLLESGLLRLDDFRTQGEVGGKLVREMKPIRRKGSFQLNGAGYNLGVEFDPDVHPELVDRQWATLLMPGIGAVVRRRPDDTKVITHTFRLKSKQEIEAVRQYQLRRVQRGEVRGQMLGGKKTVQVSALLRFGKKDGVEAIPYELTKENKRLPGETPEQYAERIRMIANFNFIESFGKELALNTGVGIHSVLSTQEQNWLASAAARYDGMKESIIQHTKTFKIEFLRTFLSCEYTLENGKKIIDLADHLPKNQAEKIFKDYNSLIDFATLVSNTLTPYFKQRLGEKFNPEFWREQLMRASARMVSEASTAKDVDAALLMDGRRSILEEAAVELANTFSAEEVRDIFQRSKTPSADEILQYINPPVASTEITHDLVELYNAIQFEQYAVNEKMQKTDEEVLDQYLPREGPVVDLGTGPGRHMAKLKKEGYAVNGIDLLERHTALAKHSADEIRSKTAATITQGSWRELPYRNESHTAVYSLGRNILHEYHINEQVQLFSEAYRVLQDGGVFIFDIPDRTKGHYKKLVEEYSAALQDKGITSFRHGTIYDSPDNQHFMTRYAYSDRDIRELARRVGFRVKTVERRPLATGQGDENLYYILEKPPKIIPLSKSAKVEFPKAA